MKVLLKIILSCFLVLGVSLPLCLLIKHLLPVGLLPTVLVCLISVLIAMATSYLLGLNSDERQFVYAKSIELSHKVFRR